MKNRKDTINNTICYRLISCLMLFMLLTNPSMAKSALIDGLTYTVMDSVKQTVCVTANCHYVTEKNIIKPEKVQLDGIEYTVTTVGHFGQCDKIVSVVIPPSVDSIGNTAFLYCQNLKSIEIPSSVTSIGAEAFHSCYKLTSIEIPSSVTSIGNAAFMFCINLTTVNIPDSLKEISSSLFRHCANLRSVTIPSSVTSIGDFAFSQCSRLASVDFLSSSSLISIGKSVFVECDSLASLNIPNSVKSIGATTFQSCTSLTSVVLPDSIDVIPTRLFHSCENLQSVNIPKNVSKIENEAFQRCHKLSPFVIPESVENIGLYSFSGVDTIIYGGSYYTGSPWGARHLIRGSYFEDNFWYGDETKKRIAAYVGPKSVVIVPDDVEIIGEKVFKGTHTVIYNGKSSNSPWGAKRHIVGTVIDGDFVYEDETKETLVGYIGTDSSVIIPDNVKNIGYGSFSTCDWVKTVSIPSSVKSIDYHAFWYCSGLLFIDIPDSVISIGSEAFGYCTNLSKVYIPASVTDMGYNVFVGCTSMVEHQDSVGLRDGQIFENAIYCQAEEQPSGWDRDWNPDSCKVVWNSTCFVTNNENLLSSHQSSKVIILGLKNTIVIENASEDVFVFDMNGQLIMSYPNVQQQIRIPIKSGTYIVKVGDVKRMVIVT